MKIPPELMVHQIATRGNKESEMIESVIDMHRLMRVHYHDMAYKVGRNIYPLIIARDNLNDKYTNDIGRQGIGGHYTLFLEDGSVFIRTPTPKYYELYKSLSHIPLGIWTMISPYLLNDKADSWWENVDEYHILLTHALKAHINADTMKASIRELAGQMLNLTNEYLTTLREKRSVNMQEYMAFTQKMVPHIITAMDEAARIEVEAGIEVCLEWKKMIGEPLWSQIIVAVPAIWPTSDYSPRYQVFKTVMEPSKVESNLFVLQGTPTVEDIKDLLGRILSDRLAAKFIFNPVDNKTKTPRNDRLYQALCSHTDLVADSSYKAVKNIIKRGCPLSPKEI